MSRHCFTCRKKNAGQDAIGTVLHILRPFLVVLLHKHILRSIQGFLAQSVVQRRCGAHEMVIQVTKQGEAPPLMIIPLSKRLIMDSPGS